MTTVPVINYRRHFMVDNHDYELNISARKLDSNPSDVYAELIIRTVKLWLYIAKAIHNNITALPEEIAYRSVEQSIEEDSATDEGSVSFDGFDENRVTVFDWNHKLEMTLHSNSLPQSVLDLYWAMHEAKSILDGLYPSASQSSHNSQNSSATPPDKPATPKAQNGAANAPSGVIYTKKEAIAQLQPGDNFKWLVVQIKKRSEDGKDYYEFYEPYGGKPGDFAAKKVFTDNEIAVNNGLIAYLDSFGIQMGQALTGKWITNCTVGKPKTKTIKGEEKTFTDIYINSFDGQPQHA